MEDEVMQFQTIILMLMRIERVNVEIILEYKMPRQHTYHLGIIIS